ncbi:carbohydrate kinase [Actinotalea ferrariae]|uniref:carbohydrate kinase family protein n=1 Tax=Actinotalea ferrariae TaxID=1386098 RepID=UPI001C8C72BB|nr:carbohydrate kinase [Actinotalea ferrariae]MBX9244182.1 carbohydrate kinase [Actinotalea ferrariae]
MTEPTTPSPDLATGVAEPPSGVVEGDVTERAFDPAPEDSAVVASEPAERRALVVGEALVDAVRAADGSVEEHPGGSPANVALGLARLGREVDLLTWIGDDERGAMIRRHLEASGVAVAPGSDSASRTSVATAVLDADGAATYDFDLSWHVPERWASPPAAPLVVHTGSIAAVLEPGGADVANILAAHRDSATLTYDPNLRPSLMPPPEETRPVVEALVAMADVVKVSDEDLAWLEPGSVPVEVARRWAASGPALVVVTRGGEGATAITAAFELDIAAPPVTVADTVGAGDSFMGGLIDGLWSAGLLGADRRTALRDVDEVTLRSLLSRCAEIAAITVSRPGANPPTVAELEQR